MSEWIKCNERMPGVGSTFLASGVWFDYAVIGWDGVDWVDLDYEGPVTHWQPLPKPPTD